MCTGIRFSDGQGNMYFGRNLDWSCSFGEQVLITPKGYEVASAFEGSWVNERPIIGMGIVADGFPLYFDCANADGLAVAGLNFPGYAEYAPQAVSGMCNIAAYEFPLWVASRFSCVDDAEHALENALLVGKAFSDDYDVSLLHWIIGDARCSIVVEQTATGMHVYRNDADVLANQPEFGWHRENLRTYITANGDMPGPVMWGSAKLEPFGSGAGMRGIPGDCYSPSRFVKAAFLNAHYPQKDSEGENVTRLFKTLGGVSMVDGSARMADGRFEKTMYTGGFSSKTKTYYYATYDDPAIKSVALDASNSVGSSVISA